MKTFGWIYIIAYCVDALIGLLATLTPAFEALSNAVSIPVSLMSFAVIALAGAGKMRPRKMFLILSVFYMITLCFGIFLGVLMVAKLGPTIITVHKVTLDFFRDQFAWYGPVHWILMIVWLFLSVYGVVVYRNLQWPVEDAGE